MKGKYFLSEILTDDTRFEPHVINMVVGNTGCGKSEFALNVLPQYAQSNYCILYLCDTNMNTDQILTHHKDDTTEYDKEWRKFINANTKVQIINRAKIDTMNGWGTWEPVHVAITTMTYAKVGAILYYGHKFDWSKFDFIKLSQEYPRFKNPQILSGGMNCDLKTESVKKPLTFTFLDDIIESEQKRKELIKCWN